MDAPFGPDGLPASFDGGAWRSHDGLYWWNGAAWVPAAKKSLAGPWLVKFGSGLVLLALLGYAVYATVATQSEYAVGYWVGIAAFFGVLLAIYRLAGRWGWFGIVIRAGCGLLALVKILTLIAHPPPH